MYEKPVAQFGKAKHVQWIGAANDEQFFVVPRQQSLLAVDYQLLSFLSDDLNFSGTTFSAAAKVWARRHCEVHQRHLTMGEDITTLQNVTRKIEDAWFMWNATLLAKGSDAGVEWDFTDEGLERCG